MVTDKEEELGAEGKWWLHTHTHTNTNEVSACINIEI